MNLKDRIRTLLDGLGLALDDRILEVGCGSGTVTRSIDMAPLVSAALDEVTLENLGLARGGIAPGGGA